MQQMLRLMIAALAAVALAQFSGVAAAQEPVKQIKLTDKQVEGFIAAQKDMSRGCREAAEGGDKPDPKLAGRARGHRQEARLQRASTSTTTSPPTSPW